MWLSVVVRFAPWWLCVAVATQQPAVAAPGGSFVAEHCLACHGGDVVKGGLDLTTPPASEVDRLWRWQRMRLRVAAAEMPPPGEEPPTAAARGRFVAAVAAELLAAVPRLPKDPGRVTVRRLSRTQWANCVRDLCGVVADTARFPADDLGYGFDTVGDALSFSTLHLEQYLAAAGAVAAEVFPDEDATRPAARRFEAEAMPLVAGPGVHQDGEVALLYTNATLEQVVELPRDGRYRLRVCAASTPAGDQPARLALRIDDAGPIGFDVPERTPQVFEHIATLPRGRHRLALAFTNDHYDPKHPDPTRRDRNLSLDWLEVVGPLDARVPPEAQRWLHEAVGQRGDDTARLRAFVPEALGRLWRRPASREEVARLQQVGSAVLRAGGSLALALQRVLQAALASPHFLFRLEPGATGALPGSKPGAVVPLPPVQLASRLSFFLWASAPDEALLELGRRGRLGAPEVLSAQIDRMLADPRAEALATDFATQWFELKLLWERTPDPARFPGFDDALRASLRRETELLFLSVLRDGRDVRTLLSADFTHVDARLARHYGWPAPADGGWQRVSLPPDQRERGGVLGHGSVLAITSNPTRTSPVKRGRWILDNLLGQAPPPPPPGNDTLAGERTIDSSRSLREQLAQHREAKACAVCHQRMDALGFALERYDAVGRRRDMDAAGPIDCTGELPDGRRLDGLAGVVAVLRDDPQFVQLVARKLFTYALGREPRPVDQLRLVLAVEDLLARGPVTLADLIRVVVRSDAFLHRVVAPRG
jgi:mono/diheme cytochrome c family protein